MKGDEHLIDVRDEAGAWRLIAEMLEQREDDLAYAPEQPNLCRMVGELYRLRAITLRTFLHMLHRLRLFRPYEDTKRKALYWDRHYRASRLARITAAWFLHAMAKRREPLE